MSSIRNHRIIIASLFLPHTAILGPDPLEDEEFGLNTGYTTEDDGTVTPVELGATPDALSLMEVTEKLQNEKQSIPVPSIMAPPTPSAAPGLPLSIVEDLKDRAAAGRERPGLNQLRRVSTPGNRSPTHEAANPFLTPGGSLSGTKSMEGKPAKKFPLTLPAGKHVGPSPLSQSTIKSSDNVPSPISSPPSSSRSSTVAQAAALKRSISRQRSRNISSKRSSRSSSRAAGHASLASSVASLDSMDSLSSRLEEAVEEGEEEFHIAPNPHVNGGLKNAIDSVSAAMMHGFAPQAASAPPTRSSFSFVPGHSRSTSLASVSASHGLSTEFTRLWIGCLDTKTDDWDPKLRERVEEALPQQEGGAELPVWVEDSVFEGC